LKVSIIGTGLQFSRRAPVIQESLTDKLVSISGLNKSKGLELSKKYNCDFDNSWEDTIKRKDNEVIIITTPPNLHAEITIKAIKNGKHVLCEKPLSKTIDEAIEMHATAKKYNKILKCGFNHRHHPAMLEAKLQVENGNIGKALFARCVYGICGRPEYQKEWRANPLFAAGGQFIEQGSHGIDLLRWYLGEVEQVSCMTSTHYFKEQNLEDDGFAIFRFKSGATASLHTSLVQWQNTFLLELFGTEGYFRITGIGGTYDSQKLFLGKRDFFSPFQDHVIQFRGSDKSWKNEWIEFKNSIENNKEPIGNSFDGLQAMKIAFACYDSNKLMKNISLK
jgi:predicted dehydrogenase